jgi:integrative and conjugative element protein (TIGR02256 family)
MGLTYTVRIGAPLREHMRRLADASRDGRETGGILLGHGPNAEGSIEIAHVGDPGPGAERRSDFFLRDLHHGRRLAAKAWLEDGSDWIGEWHTHPAGGCEPSPRDLRTYTEILTTTPGLEVLVALILTPGCRSNWNASRISHWVVCLSAPGKEGVRVQAVRSRSGRMTSGARSHSAERSER